jgi:hypothetical protein
MKNLLIKTIALSITVIMFAISCKKVGPAGATGATGPAGGPIMTGNIEGLITLYNSGSGISNIGDSIILTNNGTGKVYKTTTTINNVASNTGSYTFANVPSGTYSFTVSKPGYGTVKAFGFEFVGGGTAYRNFGLYPIPTTSITTAIAAPATIVSSGTTTINAINISGTVPSSTLQTYVMVFVSFPSNNFVNGTQGNYSDYSGFLYVSSGTTGFTYNIAASTLYTLGFTSGSIVYFAAYICTNGGISYTDPITGLNVYTDINSTPVITSCLVP